LGCQEVPRVFVKHPISDQTKEQLYEKADAVYDQVVEILQRNSQKEKEKEEEEEEEEEENLSSPPVACNT